MFLCLGIEFGSTRIKSVLINETATVLAQGSHEWENELVDGLWSYSLDAIEKGVQNSYADLIKNYGKPLTHVDAIGVSGMMHGYLAFDKNDRLLAPFRTWRNTNTSQASLELTQLLQFHVPMRWSVSQYYQSILNGLEHVKDVAYLTTLSGYAHYRLTGQKVLGINDASGMFPVLNGDYDKEKLEKFNALLKSKGFNVQFETLLPKVMLAGENAGILTEEGAKWLDVEGNLQAGAMLCPPEGDMGSGMIATNSITPRTGNVSSGTCANFTVILEKPLEKYYPEIDVIATPNGHPAALIHTNNCTSEINKWIQVFGEVTSLFGLNVPKHELFTKLFEFSTKSDENTGNLTAYNFLGGEPLAGTSVGAPMLARSQNGKMNLANFMQAQIYSAVATLGLGMDILEKENVNIDSVLAHGGFYKTDFIGQNATSAVLKAPVTIIQTASEGGAWGMALLALYATNCAQPLEIFLNEIFKTTQKKTVMASDDELKKCARFMENYRKGLQAEKILSDNLYGI